MSSDAQSSPTAPSGSASGRPEFGRSSRPPRWATRRRLAIHCGRGLAIWRVRGAGTARNLRTLLLMQRSYKNLDNAITLVSTRPTATWTPQRELSCRTFGAGWLARPTKPATAGQILNPAGGINPPGLDIGQVAGARPARSDQARLLDRGSVPGRSARPRSWPRPVTCAGSPPPSPWSSPPAGHRGSGCPPSSPARPASAAPAAAACAWPPADRRALLVGRRVREVFRHLMTGSAWPADSRRDAA